MIKKGKITRLNEKANRKLKELFSNKLGITWCEARLVNCLGTQFLQFAHRHKRVWYRSRSKLLYSENQVILVCQNCHQRLERDRGLTEEVFERCRGVETFL